MSIILPLGRLRQEDHLKSDQVRLHREYQATQDSVLKKKKSYLCHLGGWKKTFLTGATNTDAEMQMRAYDWIK